MEICFATNNEHKLKEIRELLGNRFRVLSLDEIGCKEELPETQNSLEGNSKEKAEYIYKKYGIPCFADDTGLEVESLGGDPGVKSARYAGDHKNSDDNIALLLENLQGTRNRKARFRTVITLRENKGVIQFEGIVEGEIIKERKGEKGFGYDPVFRPIEEERTFAEMPLKEKNKISHRARAFRKLIRYLKSHSDTDKKV